MNRDQGRRRRYARALASDLRIAVGILWDMVRFR